MSFYMNQGPSNLANLSHDELKELLQDDFKLDERVQETVSGISFKFTLLRFPIVPHR